MRRSSRIPEHGEIMATAARNLLFSYSTAGPIGDAGLLLLRVFAGVALALAHGINKLPPAEGFVNRIGGFGFPAPELFGWLSGFAEFGGGLLLAAGLITRPVATLIVINMLVAVVFGHAGDPFARRELAMLFGLVAAQFALVGAGRYSLDRLLAGPTVGR
jgi:putative oxidoreductase